MRPQSFLSLSCSPALFFSLILSSIFRSPRSRIKFTSSHNCWLACMTLCVTIRIQCRDLDNIECVQNILQSPPNRSNRTDVYIGCMSTWQRFQQFFVSIFDPRKRNLWYTVSDYVAATSLFFVDLFRSFCLSVFFLSSEFHVHFWQYIFILVRGLMWRYWTFFFSFSYLFIFVHAMLFNSFDRNVTLQKTTTAKWWEREFMANCFWTRSHPDQSKSFTSSSNSNEQKYKNTKIKIAYNSYNKIFIHTHALTLTRMQCCTIWISHFI